MKIADDVKINHEASGGDAGLVLNGTCPKCKENLMVGEAGWWDIECKCGHEWEVKLILKAKI